MKVGLEGVQNRTAGFGFGPEISHESRSGVVAGIPERENQTLPKDRNHDGSDALNYQTGCHGTESLW